MNFSGSDLAALAAILRDAARAEIMPRFRKLGAADVRQKTGPLDLVTDADVAAERQITTHLTQRFAGCLVVGEEAASSDASLVPRLAGAELAFVVDPVDGTANFAAGLPLFAVMAAAMCHGEVAAAAIHDPVGGDTALALRGGGAWMEGPDGRRLPLRVAAPGPVAQMTGNVAWRYMPEPARSTICRNLPRLGGSWDYRCAAHEYRATAAGHWHFLVFNRLYPWDHAPGWLLHREAGGYAAHFDGSEYSVARIDGGLLCAPDRESWEALRQTLLG